MLGNIIGGFIVILVGTALLPTVAQQVGTAQADGNVTGASDTLVGDWCLVQLLLECT